MKKLLFLGLLSLCGKNPSENRTTYRQLTWDDFQGPVLKNKPNVGAESSIQLELQTICKDGRYTYKVVAYFLKDSSFVRIRKDFVLRHEQTHFTIAYLESLKCIERLRPLQNGDSTTQQMANKIWNEACDADFARQDQFDEASRHSEESQEEEAWEDRISSELRIFGNHDKRGS